MHKYSASIEGRPFARILLLNERGRFSIVAYDDVARRLLDIPSGTKILVQGSLRQRAVNGRALYEIAIKEFWRVEE